MRIHDAFEAFLENIRLTPSQREDAITKYEGVCKKLHEYFYPEIKYNGNTKLLIGSYGKHTHIRPPRDIDVVFFLPPDKHLQYDDNRSNGQSQLLQDIRRILQERYQNTPVEAWGKVVVLKFTDTHHSVELLPAWENDDGSFTIPNSEDGGSWERWDPRLEMKQIDDSDKTTKKTRSLIRIIKKWSENCTVQIKSYRIENTILEFLSNYDTTSKEYSVIVRDFFLYFENACTDAATKSHLKTAVGRATEACDFEKNNELKEASNEWKKIFGNDFPSVETEKSVVVTFQQIISNLQSLFPATTEEYLDRKYGIATALDPAYWVKVDVNINQTGWRQNHWLLGEFQKRGYRIQKRASLLFKIISHNVPEPYSVKWKVRNFGDEAQGLSALRGEITDDDGSETKKESTLYHGEHYVECYIIKNGQCVATGHVFVPIG